MNKTINTVFASVTCMKTLKELVEIRRSKHMVFRKYSLICLRYSFPKDTMKKHKFFLSSSSAFFDICSWSCLATSQFKKQRVFSGV